jgi:phage gp29-like protein
VSAASYLRGLFARAAPTAKAGDLLKEQGGTSVGDIRTSQRKSEADQLTPTKLSGILKRADQGDVTAYLTLAEEMEERESHYRSVLGTRKLGVSGSPVSVESPSDDGHDKAIAEDVERLVERPEFEGLVGDCMDAVAKSFACIEILWDRDAKRWEPQGYAFREQRHFLFDLDTLSTPLLRSLQHPQGEPLMPFKWVVHMPQLKSGVPIRGGLARPVSLCYAAKKYTITDWLAFLDTFGMPVRVGKYPSAMASRKPELMAAVRAIGASSAGVIPEEMSIEFIEAKSGSGNVTLFQQAAEYWDKQISKVVLGQTMTTDDGASLAQSKTHERVRFDIRKADARAVAATINRDLVKPFVDLNYGPQKAYPKIRISCEEPEDTKALMDSVKVFVDLGGKVQESVVRDRLGLPEPEDGADLLKPAAKAPVAPPGQPGAKPTPGKPAGKDPAADDDGIEGGPGKQTELNSRQRFAVDDAIVDLRDAALRDWRELLDGNVGRLLREIEGATSWDELRAKLTELEREAGDKLDIGPLTKQLAREGFRARGIGDATDDTTP